MACPPRPQPASWLLQVRRWGEELATLRRAAPDADRQWLARNSKRCPQCRAHIQARPSLGGSTTACEGQGNPGQMVGQSRKEHQPVLAVHVRNCTTAGILQGREGELRGGMQYSQPGPPMPSRGCLLPGP